MCDKAVDNCPFEFISIPDQYKTQEMYNKVVLEEPFMLKYCVDWYKTQEISDKAVDALQIKYLKNLIMLYCLVII